MQKILWTIFIALLIDLFAFTLILPLLPTIINEYRRQDSAWLAALLDFLNGIKSALHRSGKINPKWDTVLIGGLLGSMFSFLQSIASPIIGRCADKYGRRRALLLTMVGNIASSILWMRATTFPIFLLSRVVGGLSEGNVQLSILMLSDSSSNEKRSSHLAVVGIAFSLAFTLGPLVGALSQDCIKDGAAAICLTLLLIETAYIYIALPETKPADTTPSAQATPSAKKGLNKLSLVHFLFLLFFSGLEFSLTFLTFDVFGFGPRESGKLLGFLGLLGSVIQGAYTRRTRSEKGLAIFGILACAAAYLALANVTTVRNLYLASSLLGISSATVVTCLTSLASKASNKESRGLEMGAFRGAGQIGRAIGPIIACCGYWWYGRQIAYYIGASGMLASLALTLAI